jgi:hypothetical protein
VVSFWIYNQAILFLSLKFASLTFLCFVMSFRFLLLLDAGKLDATSISNISQACICIPL